MVAAKDGAFAWATPGRGFDEPGPAFTLVEWGNTCGQLTAPCGVPAATPRPSVAAVGNDRRLPPARQVQPVLDLIRGGRPLAAVQGRTVAQHQQGNPR